MNPKKQSGIDIVNIKQPKESASEVRKPIAPLGAGGGKSTFHR